MTSFAEGFRRETVVAMGAVERALELARRGVGAKDITSKGARDLVTATDVAVEDAVRGIVHDALGFPVIWMSIPTARSGARIASCSRTW